ncbi:MAG: endonuclease/exonuclease/phosphatase family protein [Synechococcales cyanobacterium RM1_1_8]|nr:endonuclease/exonuclease/phosphatase family protein [Synechococcales cyanobacterium RM1_1_8]
MTASPAQRLLQVPSIVNGIAIPLVLLTLLMSALSYLGRVHLFFELLSHFRFQYFLLSWVPFVLLALTREKPWIWVAFFVLGLNGVAIAPWYLPLPALAESGPPLRIMVSNVLGENDSYDSFYNLVETEQPDLLVVLELTDQWARELTDLERILPYAVIEPRENNSGIALYSKLPLDDVAVPNWSASLGELPSITAQIDWQGKLVELVATHPAPPINPAYFEARNQHLDEMAFYARGLGRSTIVAGDLNTTMWSPFYQSLTRGAKLKNTREGFGLQPTWPSNLPPLQIPIDHILVSRDFTVLESRRGRSVGSDHYPLIADLAL